MDKCIYTDHESNEKTLERLRLTRPMLLDSVRHFARSQRIPQWRTVVDNKGSVLPEGKRSRRRKVTCFDNDWSRLLNNESSQRLNKKLRRQRVQRLKILPTLPLGSPKSTVKALSSEFPFLGTNPHPRRWCKLVMMQLQRKHFRKVWFKKFSRYSGLVWTLFNIEPKLCFATLAPTEY